MKRLLPLLAASAALLAGCGGGGSDASSALDEALGFLPKDTPFAVAIETDPDSGQYRNANAILKKFPFGDQALSSLRGQVEKGEVSYDKDVKPILGNPFVVGVADAKAFQGSDSSDQFIAALQAKDSGKLEDLLNKDKPKEVGDTNGFKVYEDDDGDRFARKDDVVVFAGSEKLLEGALEQRDGDDRLTEDDFDKGLEGLPEDAALRMYGDAERLIKADPGSADALKVKWVKALRKFGATASVKQSEIDIDFNLQTEAGELSEGDLPLASGDQAAKVVEQAGEISFGLRNPAQIEKFGEAAGQAVDPSGYGDFEKAKRQIESQLKVDIDKDIVDQLTGDSSANVTIDGKFGIRAELKDPEAMERTLAKMAPALPRIARGAGLGTVGLAKPKGGEDFYALAQADGDSVVFGVVERALVVANDPARAGRLGTASPTTVPGAQGSVAVSADAEKLGDALLRRLASGTGAIGGQLFTGPLGELKGSLKTDTSGMTGKLTLSFD